MSSGGAPAFDRLTAPVGHEEFFRTYWERRHLHVRRDDPGYYRDTLTVEDVDRYFQSQHVSSQFLRVLKGGDFHPPEQWTYTAHSRADATNVVDLQKLFSLFDSGATLVVNSAGMAIPSLAAASEALARELRCHVKANLYITPSGAQGFDPHFDAHNVLVLQIHGRKVWSLYDVPIEAPVTGVAVDAARYRDMPPSASIDMRPGDLLYIPRGMVHAARAVDAASVHVTLGPSVSHWAKVLRLLARRSEEDPAFRRLVPHGLSTAEEWDKFGVAFARELQALVADSDLRALQEADFFEAQPLDPRGRFADRLRLTQLTQDSVVCKRRGLHCTIDRQEEWLIIRVGPDSVALPAHVAAAVDTVLGEQPFAVRDIAGLPGDAAKVALVKRLVRAGVLTLCSSVDDAAEGHGVVNMGVAKGQVE